MTTLYEALATRVDEWRNQHYLHETYSVIGEILEWARSPELSGFRLRPPQVRALETYWYLRLVENTPHIFDLYRKLFTKKSDLLQALGIPHTRCRRSKVSSFR
jgi:type III restriction enzyme